MSKLDDPSEALKDLNPHVELMDVGCREIYCVRERIEHPDDAPQFALQVELEELDELKNKKFRGIQYELKMELETLNGKIRIVVDGSYRIPIAQGRSISVALAVEYANHVALMTLLPYLRQALSDMSARVFKNQILMPVFQRGDISFSGLESIEL